MIPFTQEERNAKGIPKKIAVSEIINLLNSPTNEEITMITKAFKLAQKAHAGQKRYSNRDYIEHPFETARYLAAIGMSTDVIAAGLLHDTIEDTDLTAKDIRENLGTEVEKLVLGVTKLGTLHYHGMERHVESLRKLFAATAQDVRVMIVKLMDRRHNVLTLSNVPKHKRARIAIESIQIYASIAGRLGMGIIKRDIEDGAFPHAFPKEYKHTISLFKKRGGCDVKRFEKRSKMIKRSLSEYGITNFKMDHRVKGLYSFYKKLERKKGDVTKIYDIFALRIITSDTASCYTILGVLHAEWRPVPGRLKDYIACPKPNGYKSIHTTVYTEDGGFLEIQIKTADMHYEAQFGIAAHVGYKDYMQNRNKESNGVYWIKKFIPGMLLHAKKPIKSTTKKLAHYPTKVSPAWIQHMAKARRDGAPEEFLEEIKGDFFAHRIFVFTPKGDAIDLPLRATPIDFAYAVHSEVGDHVASVKINGKMSAIDTPLENGDYVDIQTKKSAHPSHKWLDFVKTSLAKRKIRVYLQDKNK